MHPPLYAKTSLIAKLHLIISRLAWHFRFISAIRYFVNLSVLRATCTRSARYLEMSYSTADQLCCASKRMRPLLLLVPTRAWLSIIVELLFVRDAIIFQNDRDLHVAHIQNQQHKNKQWNVV